MKKKIELLVVLAIGATLFIMFPKEIFLGLLGCVIALVVYAVYRFLKVCKKIGETVKETVDLSEAKNIEDVLEGIAEACDKNLENVLDKHKEESDG